MKIVSDATFEQSVLKSNKPVVVDFTAKWCGPCKILSPMLERLEQKTDKYNFFEVDVDKNPEIVKMFEITSMPTLIVFENGAKTKQHIGLVAEEKIKQFLDL